MFVRKLEFQTVCLHSFYQRTCFETRGRQACTTSIPSSRLSCPHCPSATSLGMLLTAAAGSRSSSVFLVLRLSPGVPPVFAPRLGFCPASRPTAPVTTRAPTFGPRALRPSFPCGGPLPEGVCGFTIASRRISSLRSDEPSVASTEAQSPLWVLTIAGMPESAHKALSWLNLQPTENRLTWPSCTHSPVPG